MSLKPANKYFIYMLFVLISCNKKIVYNEDKSCFFRKDDFYIQGNFLNPISFELRPWQFYKYTDSLLGSEQNMYAEYSEYTEYLNQNKLLKNCSISPNSKGCIDSVWMANVLVKEYEKRFGVYRIDTLFAIDIYDAKIVDSSKLHITPIANFDEDDLDSLFSLTKESMVVGGELVEDETLPGNKIYYNVGRDTLGSFFDNFKTPHTMLLNSIRKRTSPKYAGGIVDYVIKENIIGPDEKRININYRIHDSIFDHDGSDKRYIHHDVGPDAFIKYCNDYHGVKVWLERTDTFLVKKIKFIK
jgi:hypothetical protein